MESQTLGKLVLVYTLICYALLTGFMLYNVAQNMIFLGGFTLLYYSLWGIAVDVMNHEQEQVL